jgi:hypothetical protein
MCALDFARVSPYVCFFIGERTNSQSTSPGACASAQCFFTDFFFCNMLF